jgi:MerR family copper efflux transcriptional regulator
LCLELTPGLWSEHVDRQPLRIGDVAKLSELSIDTVRYYEREGLLGRVRRSSAGQREYDAESVRRLAFVRRATTLGFSLAEVKSLVGLRVSPRIPCERVRERAIGKVTDIERRIAELNEMREALGRLIERCQDSCAPGACAFLDELAQPFAPAAGPRTYSTTSRSSTTNSDDTHRSATRLPRSTNV